MVSEEIDQKATLFDRIKMLVISNIFFLVVYNFCAWYASNSDRVISYVLDFESYIPFLPWMVIPYMTSGFFFVAIFFLCSTRNELCALSKRINFITIIAGIFFLLIPLSHTFARPDMQSSVLHVFFSYLDKHDNIYNQAPSLHICYALVFWSVIKLHFRGFAKYALGLWLILMSVATITIFQHHIVDVVAAFLLVSITFCVFPKSDNRNYKLALRYALGASFLLFMSVLIYNFSSILALLYLWGSVSVGLVGYAYYKLNNGFLKNRRGEISFLKRVIYNPYILVCEIMRKYFCKSSLETVTEILPSVFIGPILNKKDCLALAEKTNITHIVDLTSEMSENSWVRKNFNYYSFPILDISVPDHNYIDNIVSEIKQITHGLNHEEGLYIHCTMGYSRCAFIALQLMISDSNQPKEKIVEDLESKYPNTILPEYLLDTIYKK